MPNITMTFPHVNDSVQVGDISYYQDVSAGGTLVQMGAISAVTATTVTTFIDGITPRPTSSVFILFSKDNRAAISAMRGYFAEVKMVNNETIQCELFDVGSEIFESSK